MRCGPWVITSWRRPDDPPVARRGASDLHFGPGRYLAEIGSAAGGQGLVWRISRACSAARAMLSETKSRKRAMFSRRMAAGVLGAEHGDALPGGLGELGGGRGRWRSSTGTRRRRRRRTARGGRSSRSRRTRSWLSRNVIALEMDAGLTWRRWTSSAAVRLPVSAGASGRPAPGPSSWAVPACMRAVVNVSSNSRTACGVASVGLRGRCCPWAWPACAGGRGVRWRGGPGRRGRRSGPPLRITSRVIVEVGRSRRLAISA